MKNAIKAVAFFLVFLVLFTLLDNLFYDHNSGWEATDDWSGQEYDIVFMGNSHVYCNINPVMVNDALGINTIDLCSPVQISELTYYNLKTLLTMTTPKAIVIGPHVVDITIDDVYEGNKQGSLYRNTDGIRDPLQRADAVIHIYVPEYWLEAYSQLFRPVNMWDRFSNLNKDFEPYGILGYIARDSIFGQPIDLNAVETAYRRSAGSLSGETDIDLRYLIRILDLCQANDIPVYFLQSPIAQYSDKASDCITLIQQLAEQYPIIKYVHNYSLDISDIGLTSDDYYDSGHLNTIGSSKFTEYLINDLGEWLGKTPDLSKIGWCKCEHVEELSEGIFRYAVDLYDGCLIRFIVKDSSGNIVTSTEFSRENTIVLPRLDKNCVLYYELKASNPESYTYDHPQTVQFVLSTSLLKSYNNTSIEISQNDQTLSFTNMFDESPVEYAWYVYRYDEAVFKKLYTDDNHFSYEFTEPGDYKVRAYVRLKDKSDSKSIYVVDITIDENGFIWDRSWPWSQTQETTSISQ